MKGYVSNYKTEKFAEPSPPDKYGILQHRGKKKSGGGGSQNEIVLTTKSLYLYPDPMIRMNYPEKIITQRKILKHYLTLPKNKYECFDF